MGLTLPILLTLGGYFIFSAAVGAMWPPTVEQKPRFYGWLYRTLQAIAANASKLAEARFGALAEFPASGQSAASTVSTSIVQQRVDAVTSSGSK